MSNHGPIFMAGDPVYYTGEKFKQELSKDGKPLKGWIHAGVQNEPGAFVVWFPDTKESDSYVISSANLSKVRPPRQQAEKETNAHDGPVVEHMPVRRRKTEDE